MTEYVSVHPDRLRDLARKLQAAASTVREKAPGIVSGIEGWDGSFSGAKLTELADWLDDQWQPMFDRADLATTAANQPSYSTPGNVMYAVPFDITEQDLAEEGRQDALDLHAAMNSDDEAIRNEAQREAAEAMEAHADDPAYLAAFYNNGGAEVITTMSRQIAEQGVPPSEQNQNRLRLFATGVAAVSRFSESGEVTLNQGALDPLSSVDNTLQNGIMMMYGPGGDQYGSAFLRTVADNALQWREDNDPPRPHYSAPMTAGTSYVPGGYVQNDDDWWTRIGIDVDYLDNNAEDAANGMELMQQFDPVNSILNRTGQNPEASRQLLNGSDGLENAQRLIDYDWQSPGAVPHDDSGPAASVLIAATQDRGDEQGQESANAAANIFQAGYDLSTRERDDYDKEQLPGLPSSLAEAMSVVATAYAPDMANSTSQPNVAINEVIRNEQGFWVVQSNTTVMNGFLKTFMTDPEAAGAFRGSVLAQMTAAAELQSTNPEAADMLTDYGYLNGMVSIAFADQDFTEAEAQDAANQQAQTYFDAASGILDAVPLGKESYEFIRSAAVASAGLSKESLFPTDGAQQVESEVQHTMLTDIAEMRTYVAQGYVNSGAYPLPEDASFATNGIIDPQGDAEMAAFDDWWNNRPQNLPAADNAQEGFEDATNVFAPNDDRFDDPPK